MSYVEALPIYRAAMDEVVSVDRGFPRYHKCALGTQLRQASLEASARTRARTSAPMEKGERR
jgi:hypothetical protein